MDEFDDVVLQHVIISWGVIALLTVASAAWPQTFPADPWTARNARSSGWARERAEEQIHSAGKEGSVRLLCADL